MRLPALLYGSYADVKKRCRKALKHTISDQQSLWHVLQVEGMLDTADHAGAIVIEALLTGNGENFHSYAPLYLLVNEAAIAKLS
jgi:hypothetical protein